MVTTVCISPRPWGDFSNLDCSINQEGANTERYVYGKLSARDVFKADLFGTDTISTVEISTIEHRPRGGWCDIHRRVR